MTYQPLQTEDATLKPVANKLNRMGFHVLSPVKQAALMNKLAAEWHLDQVDAQGDPYIYHCQKVQHYVRSRYPDDYERHTIAVGHDGAEDNKKVTWSALYEKGFSDRVIDGLKGLTNIPGESDDEALERICSNVDSMLVKALGDLRHNTDIRRGKGLRQKDFDRLVKYHTRYHHIKTTLREKHGIHI
jgi:(p)ppGpp synthase/HD superfamily hydrolase